MIIFYHKKTGQVLMTIDGRVHSQEHLKAEFETTGVNKKDVAKLIIGYEETDEKEEYEEVSEQYLPGKVVNEQGRTIKVLIPNKVKTKKVRYKVKEHNLKDMALVEKFEDNSPTTPFDYEVDVKKGKLKKKKA